MSATNTIDRLRSANPVRLESDLAHSDAARVALQRILEEPQSTPRRARNRLRSRLPRGGVAVAIALGLAGGGGAFAATNPFGWWSANPDQARYQLNPAAHARTPSAPTIGCRSGICVPNGHGQRYTRIDTLHQPGPADLWTRANLLRATEKALADHRLNAAEAAKIRRDIARVPESFFAEMRVAMRFGTYGGGTTNRVPPPGVPEFLVCEQARSGLSCQNLNGDRAAPIGAGVYMAQPASDWRPAPPERQDYGLPPGIHFTRAEYQVLIDLAKGTSTSSGGSKVRALPKRSN